VISEALHWEAVIVKLLDWPFLLFILLVVFLLLFRVHLIALLNRGDISIGWGDRTIRLRELSQNLDRELDPIRDELETLKKTVAALTPLQEQASIPATPASAFPSGARERILETLRDGKFDWRSIETLANLGGISESQTMDLLRTEPSVVLSLGKSGKPIAGLKSRVRRS
jgi:hypothetical protein